MPLLAPPLSCQEAVVSGCRRTKRRRQQRKRAWSRLVAFQRCGWPPGLGPDDGTAVVSCGSKEKHEEELVESHAGVRPIGDGIVEGGAEAQCLLSRQPLPDLFATVEGLMADVVASLGNAAGVDEIVLEAVAAMKQAVASLMSPHTRVARSGCSGSWNPMPIREFLQIVSPMRVAVTGEYSYKGNDIADYKITLGDMDNADKPLLCILDAPYQMMALSEVLAHLSSIASTKRGASVQQLQEEVLKAGKLVRGADLTQAVAKLEKKGYVTCRGKEMYLT